MAGSEAQASPAHSLMSSVGPFYKLQLYSMCSWHYFLRNVLPLESDCAPRVCVCMCVEVDSLNFPPYWRMSIDSRKQTATG